MSQLKLVNIALSLRNMNEMVYVASIYAKWNVACGRRDSLFMLASLGSRCFYLFLCKVKMINSSKF